jgi:hypothetical protein
MRKKLEIMLEIKKTKEKENFENQTEYDLVKTQIQKLEKCSGISSSAPKFLTFKENSAGLIRSIEQNIKILEQYKQFPDQLYERTHISDRYMTELTALLSNFVGETMYRLNTNANRYSQYVDAITTLVGAIETRQAIIDFSVNRSEKCSKCSNDNY